VEAYDRKEAFRMATGADIPAGHKRVHAKERTNYNDGKTMSGARQFLGPASRHGVVKTNPVKGGGITRRLKTDSYY